MNPEIVVAAADSRRMSFRVGFDCLDDAMFVHTRCFPPGERPFQQAAARAVRARRLDLSCHFDRAKSCRAQWNGQASIMGGSSFRLATGRFG